MPPRTRACAVCRRKRIKCDATLPRCLMCRRLGAECPGLDDGPLFIDMTKKARHGMQKRKRKLFVDIKPVPELEARRSHVNFDRISQQAVVTEAFYDRFLSHFTSEGDGKDIRNKKSWLHRLPQLSVDGTNDALTFAVQATAFSYCAAETNNPALARHAWDLYGRAMQRHGRFLARSRSAATAVTLHMISTSVLFSFFEAMQATNVDAYRSHVYGAAKMFEVTDPRQCSEGVLCQIFFHIRTQLAFAQLTSNGERTAIDVKKILHDTLDYEELPIFQRLTTQFTKLADAYNEVESSVARSKRTHVLDVEHLQVFEDEIKSLWDEYTESAARSGDILTWHEPSTSTTHFRDGFTALTVAYFSATRLLLFLTGPQHEASHSGLADDCRSILQAALYLQTCSVGCAYMRMAAPLLLVALHTPVTKQKMVAIDCFRSWAQGSMRGISDMALETIQRKQSGPPEVEHMWL
ncbi:hypothetical protein HBI56_034460 [Parastagonospora nodorum]|uniref:Zn(2)-C6 fungal-type domain-containing protein n=2 Tax=Phaeosphaeria nodorum (strain SN15 / ATCC MYA-4574 / FGSC 10173) TaxID=321614 RepID=A0A7U2F301_PHANO|nr:hypothetical protein HBH56_022260 [Parastagonospora nodorum]QRC95569.1 hypothetical protein JI435_032490 [Parastagonospora nodorum SN15]KAH3936847.1 hypothetical protein HBH54_012220 [Parastagonospora nodorum]KAH3967610.1 hypothetical protein HBH51_135670 [Parastagonospora nodorum]KAH3990054.1 hypothetical protein HBH52_001170 [Parastagonospora nodorum]